MIVFVALYTLKYRRVSWLVWRRVRSRNRSAGNMAKCEAAEEMLPRELAPRMCF